jgi:hypothetical protein
MPARTAKPPTPNSRPSCRPAVPPPPVSGAAAGKAGAAADVCVARGVDDRTVDDGVAVADAGAEACDEAVACGALAECVVPEACGELVACGELAVCAGLEACAGLELCAGLDVCAGLEAWAEVDADAPARPVVEVCAGVPGDRDPWPVGDGVRVPACVCDEGGVCTEGVKIVGTDEPPPVQAETVTAMRMAPAAERPAVSHTPWVSPGGVSRTFMSPPRMRVR